MLQTCGIHSIIISEKEDNTTPVYKLNIYNVSKLKTLGFYPLQINIFRIKKEIEKSNDYVKITNIIDNKRIDKTYCCNEPKRHAILVNGIITGNCSEIMEVTNENESAVCNLASVSLSSFVKFPTILENKDITIYTMKNCKPCYKLKKLLDKHNVTYTQYEYKSPEHKQFVEKYKIKTVPQLVMNDKHIGGYEQVKDLMKPYYDFDELYETTKLIITNLNKVIDINFYPSSKTKHSNQLHRPIGLGVQGLADVYCKMKYPF